MMADAKLLIDEEVPVPHLLLNSLLLFRALPAVNLPCHPHIVASQKITASIVQFRNHVVMQIGMKVGDLLEAQLKGEDTGI